MTDEEEHDYYEMDDMTDEEAYDEIVKLAREHALIWQAVGGIVTIVHPDTQRSAGLYAKIQAMHGRKV
jgi:hypothetical protein